LKTHYNPRRHRLHYSCLASRLLPLYNRLCRYRNYRVARSPVFYGRSRISAPVSRLPKGSRPEDRISRRLFDYRLIQIGRIYKLCDSNLQHAPWCDEHKSLMQRTTLLRSAYFCRNSTLFWTTVFNYIDTVHYGSRRTLAS